MIGIGIILLALIFIGVGTQAKQESDKEVAMGLPGGKFTGTPFYVLGGLFALLGVLLLTGVIDFSRWFS